MAPASRAAERSRTLSIIRIITAIGAIRVLTVAFGVVQSKIAAVTVGPAGIGVISLIDGIVVLVAQVSNLSLPFAALKGLASAHDLGREEFARGYAVFLRSILVLSLLGAGISIALVLIAPKSLLAEMSGYARLLAVALIAVPTSNVAALLTNVQAASQRPRASAVMGLVAAAVLALATATGVLAAGLTGFYVGAVTAGVVFSVGGIVYLARWQGMVPAFGSWRLLAELRRHRHALGFAVGQYVLAFTAPLAFLVARYAIVRHGDFASAGLLQAAMALGLAMRTVLGTANALFLTPAMNRSTEPSAKFQEATAYFRAVSLLIGMVAFPLILFPGFWLSLVYSADFVGAAPYVYLFVLSEALILLGGVNQALLIGLDQIAAYLAVCLVGQAGIALGAWWLVPTLGMAGVAIGLLLNGTVVLTLTTWWVWRYQRMALLRAVGWLPLVVLVAVLGTGAVAAHVDTTLPVAVTKVVICLVCVLGGLWSLGVLQPKLGRS